MVACNAGVQLSALAHAAICCVGVFGYDPNAIDVAARPGG